MFKRVKQISKVEFAAIQNKNWVPSELVGDALPGFLQSIPKEKIHKVMASGSCTPDLSGSYIIRIPSGELIGGIDVYRHAPDDPVEFNKDWYAVIRDVNNANIFLVEGPIKDDEHWLDEIPERLKGAEILDVLKKQEQKNPLGYGD